MSYEHFKIYDLINNWIKFSDTKAGVIIAFNMSLLGVVLNKADKFDIISQLECSKYFFILILFIFFLSSVLSMFNAILSVHPSLKTGTNGSNIYFAHIAKRDLESFRNDIASDKYSFEDDLSSQIKTNSDICWKKYVRISWAIKFAIAAVSAILIAIIFVIAN